MGNDRGLFLSVLDELARGGQITRNLIAGRPDSALRQLEQLGANAVDAALPGDLLPNDIAQPGDYISGRELLGAPDDWTGHLLGYAAEVGTDPISYVPGSVVAKGLGKAGELASNGVSALDRLLPGTEANIAKAGRSVRDFFGQQRDDMPELYNAVDRARGAASVEGRAGLASTKQALGGLDARQRKIVSNAIDNTLFGPDGKPVSDIVPEDVDAVTGAPFRGLRDRIAAHPDAKPEEVDQLTNAANQLLEISRNQKMRPGVFDAASQANLPDEYLARQYDGLKQDPLDELMGGAGPGQQSAMKERSNAGWRDIRDTLESNPGSTYEQDALARMAKRSSQQAELAKRADVGSAVWDLLRQGKMSLPEDAVLAEATKLRSAAKSAPVPESGAYEDVGAMLGGQKADPAVADPYGTELGAGKAKVSEQADVSSMLGGKPVETELPEGVEDANAAVQADQSGRAVVGESTEQPRLTKADFKPDELEAATKSILGKDFALSDPDAKNLVRQALGELSANGAPESAKLALEAFNGMAPRGTLMKMLSKANSWWKRAATYGMLIPRAGALFRNRWNMPFQVLANPATRSETLQAFKTLPSDLSGAVSDALGSSIGKDAMSGTLEEWEHALANSGGSAQKAIETFGAKHPEAAAFLKHGGLDSGFVRSEDLINEAQSSDLMRKAKSWLDFPGRIMVGLEDRMRLGLGQGLIKKYMKDGLPLDEAAKKAVRDSNDALFRYNTNSTLNRTYKDIFPFGSWVANAVPAEAKFLAEKPIAASLVANAASNDPNSPPNMPWMDDRLALDLGPNSDGDRNVLTGLGLPVETLFDLPNPSASLGDVGREVEHDVVAQMAPSIKTLYNLASGRDANFGAGATFGGYDRLPLVGESGDIGRVYNAIAGTGLTAPIDTGAKVLDRLLDDRHSLPERLMNTFTGAQIATVDPLKAEAAQLQQDMERNPSISQSVPIGHDEDSKEMIRRLQDVQKKLRRAKAHKKPG